MTETSSFNRQPSNLDYAANTQFRFLIDKLPKTEFFVKAANIPGISIGEVTQPTPLSNITLPGDTLSFENLNITFIVDEFFNNYIEVQDWMRGTAFPVDHKEYLDLLRTGRDKSPQSIPSRVSIEAGKTGNAPNDAPIYSDGILTILSSKNNPIAEVRFRDLYPVSLSGIDFTQDATDVTYLESTFTMGYAYYEIFKLT